MAVPTKQYGLILPQKKGAKGALQRPCVFGDDSDEETTVGQSLQKEAEKKKMMKQTRLEMQKALEEDSTVYDYDAVYDDIQKQRQDSSKKLLGGADKRPKYIHQLMKAAEDRKKEQERQDERKIQKEREAEGEQFADKDAYVTSAYKQKLLERAEEAEREKSKAALEAALDVRKQRDLSGFYRHLLNRTVGEETVPDHSLVKMEVSKPPETTSPPASPPSLNNAHSSDSEDEGHEQKSTFNKTGSVSHAKRQYRQRSPSSDSGEAKEREKEKERQRKSHRDKDRDRGRDRDRDRERDRDRNRGRDDRHGGRREDRDRRKDRDREHDRGKGRGDVERHGRRDRSPKDRERDREKNGERERRRNPDEDVPKDKDKDQGDEREARVAAEKETETTANGEDGEPQRTDEAEQETKQDGEAEKGNKFAKRSTEETVTSARDRYLARQIARSACKAYIEKEED